MKFVLVSEPIVDWPVKVRVPVSGGRFQEQVFTGQFKVVSVERQRGLAVPSVEEALNGADGDGAFLREVFVGWSDNMSDENGDPIKFADEIRDQLIGIPYVRTALTRAYVALAEGGRRKN